MEKVNKVPDDVDFMRMLLRLFAGSESRVPLQRKREPLRRLGRAKQDGPVG